MRRTQLEMLHQASPPSRARRNDDAQNAPCLQRVSTGREGATITTNQHVLTESSTTIRFVIAARN